MAKNRMAGDKLDEPTQESADAKEALSQSERRKRGRERIGNDPKRLAERISVVDRDKYDVSDYTDKEINMAMQGGTFDDNDYGRLTGNPVEKPDDDGKPDKEDPDVSIPKPTPTPTPTPEEPGRPPYVPPRPPVLGGPGSQTQIVNQDNDITSNVSGDNNTVTNTQDNSVNQYGGGFSPAARSKYLRDRYVADVSRFVRA